MPLDMFRHLHRLIRRIYEVSQVALSIKFCRTMADRISLNIKAAAIIQFWTKQKQSRGDELKLCSEVYE